MKGKKIRQMIQTPFMTPLTVRSRNRSVTIWNNTMR